jgi:Protein of unknown function (DUF1566)
MPKRMLTWEGVLMVAVIAWVGGSTPPAWAQRARVPQTGQTTCWDAAGSPINCEGTGQNGDLQAGVAWATPRFTDCREGTVRDNLTGLIWLKNANCFGALPWANALSEANHLASGRCGLTDGSIAGDWRLPKVKELQSLIDFGDFGPALPDGHPFSGVQPSTYWSSTTKQPDTVPAVDPGVAWGVSLNFGNTSDVSKNATNPLWPVWGATSGETSSCDGLSDLRLVGLNWAGWLTVQGRLWGAGGSRHQTEPEDYLYQCGLEIWQRFAGKWATGATGQKPCATTAQPLLILHGFLTHSLD